MIKLLFIKTGNIFTLPDEEALRIKSQDRANEYKILDAGYLEEKTEEVSAEEVEKLVSIQPEPLSDELPDESVPECKPSLPHTHEKEYLEMDLDLENASHVELKGYCARLGISVTSRESKKSMIAKIKETGIVK